MSSAAGEVARLIRPVRSGDVDEALTGTPQRQPVGGSYTFGGRQGRMSPTRQRALDDIVPRYLVDPGSLAAARGTRRITVEIGCGKGDATAAMASVEPEALVIACEPNRAMIASLAIAIDVNAIDNVRLWVGDAFDLLGRLDAGSVAEIRIWFPDPWPKMRQAGKRLIVPARLALITDALELGGLLRIATDDSAYAEQALRAIERERRLEGRTIERPSGRPVTVFEQRGLRAGRAAIDIEARRVLVT
ncbi:MAG: tRNA (guanine(46)-N(7))-methyltransferase TrmB [Ilumatobacteraceae bacterium]